MEGYIAHCKSLKDNKFYDVKCSRIFKLSSDANGDTREPFDPLNCDLSVSYGVVIGTNLVKHQVLLVASNLLELQALKDAKGQTKLRAIPCPKRLSIGEVAVPIQQYRLVDRAQGSKRKQSASHKESTVAQRNERILNAMKAKSDEKMSDLAKEGQPPPKRHRKDNKSDEASDMVTSPAASSTAGTPPIERASNQDQNQHQSKIASAATEVNGQPNNTATAAKALSQQVTSEQLEVALRETEAYRERCSLLEDDVMTSLKSQDKKLSDMLVLVQQLTTNVTTVTEFIQNAKERSDQKKESRRQPCKLSTLTDMAPCSSLQINVPEDQVHMGDGFFLSKEQLVAIEKEVGLRPRLKALLSFMYGDRISTKYASKPSSVKQVSKIPDNHITAFINTLEAMEWNKGKKPEDVLQDTSKFERHLSKALSELKSEGYPVCTIEKRRVLKTERKSSPEADAEENEGEGERKEATEVNDPKDNGGGGQDDLLPKGNGGGGQDDLLPKDNGGGGQDDQLQLNTEGNGREGDGSGEKVNSIEDELNQSFTEP